MPGSLDVLKDCIIFVDVRTEEGEDAAALFVDMLRGLGARASIGPGKSCTHLVYKAGLPSTISKYKLLPEPRPLPVSIGWVVECVEKRAHVDETRFLVNLNEIGVAGGIQVCTLGLSVTMRLTISALGKASTLHATQADENTNIGTVG
ncbi:hypothetical protein JB92DRAFT_2721312 [Gautieria morchelliformis]|nr:hypothetical protein JB92DRAFT_2721312 [Gautieria morchelliformis]